MCLKLISMYFWKKEIFERYKELIKINSINAILDRPLDLEIVRYYRLLKKLHYYKVNNLIEDFL